MRENGSTNGEKIICRKAIMYLIEMKIKCFKKANSVKIITLKMALPFWQTDHLTLSINGFGINVPVMKRWKTVI